MAKVKVSFHSTRYVPIAACQEVALVLNAAGKAKTSAADGFLLATVSESGGFLGSGGYGFSPRFENVRQESEYQYDLEYDDSLLVSTADPVTCEHILEINPYSESVKALR